MPATTPEPDKAAGGAVQSVDRALHVLEMIGRAGTAGVTELAVELGVHKSTVSRIIGSLEARGFVEQVPDSRKYRIGFTVVRLAGSTTATLDLAKQGQDICNALAADTGETTNLAVLGGADAINVVEAQGSSSVALQTWVGQSTPAHATSSGKALLSGLTADELRATMPARLRAFTENTITSLSALTANLDIVRERGWAMAEEELEVGLIAVAAPIRDHTGRVVSSLSISGPRYRFAPEDAPQVAAKVMRAATELNERFGYYG
ncbi:IclR family transcriptional regulator [Gordonia sp. PKS22-38]|uniref:IclR family transcriptional regulator n=1 Tax=Gordonia prachuapensis TaxID=3115651 RepID=A0ABU7MZ31_9ACTN|nr:IclR family transcriptional regulator [Gordonia sp. PKS22-38]